MRQHFRVRGQLWYSPWPCNSARARAQMTSTEEELLSLDFYARKTFFKTASLMANSCKAIALLGGQSAAVAQLAHDYGRHLGLAFQARAAPPSMCAMTP